MKAHKKPKETSYLTENYEKKKYFQGHAMTDQQHSCHFTQVETLHSAAAV